MILASNILGDLDGLIKPLLGLANLRLLFHQHAANRKSNLRDIQVVGPHALQCDIAGLVVRLKGLCIQPLRPLNGTHPPQSACHFQRASLLLGLLNLEALSKHVLSFLQPAETLIHRSHVAERRGHLHILVAEEFLLHLKRILVTLERQLVVAEMLIDIAQIHVDYSHREMVGSEELVQHVLGVLVLLEGLRVLAQLLVNNA
mmetsp:Transcript_29577/g.74403  ORF Transcript_29577/g.74403 Transcript_29577/m.74403 type:complete len:202 (+) Transcript_29577:432-1037(+)